MVLLTIKVNRQDVKLFLCKEECFRVR